MKDIFLLFPLSQDLAQVLRIVLLGLPSLHPIQGLHHPGLRQLHPGSAHRLPLPPPSPLLIQQERWQIKAPPQGSASPQHLQEALAAHPLLLVAGVLVGLVVEQVKLGVRRTRRVEETACTLLRVSSRLMSSESSLLNDSHWDRFLSDHHPLSCSVSDNRLTFDPELRVGCCCFFLIINLFHSIKSKCVCVY